MKLTAALFMIGSMITSASYTMSLKNNSLTGFILKALEHIFKEVEPEDIDEKDFFDFSALDIKKLKKKLY